MQDVYIGLGSNLGDRAAMLRGALSAIKSRPGVVVLKESPIYETPPMGPQDQGPYLNMAAHLQTRLSPAELVAALQQVERELGRSGPEHRQRWGPREIDLDVLLFGDRVIDEPGLIVPHPGMHQRWFVLKPLADLAPSLVHPVLGQTIAELLLAVDHAASEEVLP